MEVGDIKFPVRHVYADGEEEVYGSIDAFAGSVEWLDTRLPSEGIVIDADGVQLSILMKAGRILELRKDD